MKYLLVLAVVMVAFYVWRNNRITDRSQSSRPTPPPDARRLPVVMVACKQCGTHLPQGDTVQGAQGSYCSTEHRRLSEGGSA